MRLLIPGAVVLLTIALWAQALVIPHRGTALQDPDHTVGGKDRGGLHNETYPVIQARWISIKTEEELKDEKHPLPGMPRQQGLWPPLGYQKGDALYPQGAVRHFIPYCFATEPDAKELLRVLAHAPARWWPAFQYSSVMILPDKSCYTRNPKHGEKKLNIRCVCGKQPNGLFTDSKMTLRISLAPAKSDPGRDTSNQISGSSAPTGCDAWGTGAAGRHSLILSRHSNFDNEALRVSEQIRSMTHELGHAVGLAHEHQRADRDKFLRVDWKAMKGYNTAARIIMEPEAEQDFGDMLQLDRRMAEVCSDYDLATKYFSAAVPMLRYD